MFIQFWLNFCDRNNHIERIPVGVKNIDRLFRMASEMIESDKLHLLLISDCTLIEDNEYLESLETDTELTVCTDEQIRKFLIWFEIIISYPLNVDYFLWSLPTAVVGWLIFFFFWIYEYKFTVKDKKTKGDIHQASRH